MSDPLMGGGPSDSAVVRRVHALVAALSADDRPTASAAVLDLARTAVPSAQHVGVSVLHAGRPPTVVAACGPVPQRFADLQREVGEGPGVDGASGEAVVHVDDLGTDERWPGLTRPWVDETGIRSLLSLRFPVGVDEHAALNVFADAPGAFTSRDERRAAAVVPVAALLVEAGRHQDDVENFRAALESSRTIGTAVGILMVTERLRRDEAFDLLRRRSMDLNTKLRDLAAVVEHTGALPDGVSGGPVAGDAGR